MASSLENNLSEEYLDQISNIERFADKKVSEIFQRFPNYTLHDLDHFKQVSINLGKLVEPLNLDTDPRNNFCLLAASYCHDLGMANVSSSQEYYWLNRTEARREHAKFSADTVLQELDDIILDDGLRWAIARICEGHGRWDLDDSDYDPVENIDIRFLAVLLSIADALDLRDGRRNPKDIDNVDQLMNYSFLKEEMSHHEEISAKPELADLPLVHWLRHYYAHLPSITSGGPGSRTIYIRLRARIGIERDETGRPIRDQNMKPLLDQRKPFIEEIIQSDLQETLNNEIFQKILDARLNIKIQNLREHTSLADFDISQDVNKMLFPQQLVEAAYSGGLIRPLDITLNNSKDYYKMRIEPFFCHNDFQVSRTWRPGSLAPKKLPKRYGQNQIRHIQHLKYLAKEYWDVVLWYIDSYIHFIDEKLIKEDNFKEAKERLESLLITPELILRGELRKIFIAEGGLANPVTATAHISKEGVFSEDFPLEIKAGNIRRENEHQRAIFKSISKIVAKKLGISYKKKELEAKLYENCNPDVGYKETIKTISIIFKRIEDLSNTITVPLDFKEFVHAAAAILSEDRYRLIDAAIIKTNIFLKMASEKDLKSGGKFIFSEMELMRYSDLDKIMNIEKESFKYPWRSKDSYRKYIRKNRAFSLHRNGDIVGYLLIDFEGDTLHIIKMAVIQESRRSGFGSLIIEWSKVLADQLYLSQITLHVRESNIEAIKFYEVMGFRTIKVEEEYFGTTGNEGAVKMCLRIS